MRFTLFVVGVMTGRLKGNDIQLAMADATFGHQRLGKFPDLCGQAF
jgi:hypothetical protein